jgi:hypothetical protein
LAGGNEDIGVEESADLGVVITALQVIEPGILDRALAKTPFLPRPWFSKLKTRGNSFGRTYAV